jgi:hypothetical protein
MLDLRLLRRPAFLTSLTGALVVGLTTVALMSYAPSFLERALGWSALASSALLATWSTTSAVVAWQAHRMPSRVITRHRLALGLAICLLELLWLGQLSPAGGWSGLLPGILVTGVGTGLANAALGQLAVSSAPPGQPGLGSGANNTARYLGGAAGIAIVVSLAVPTSARPSAAQFVSGWDAAATVCAVLSALGIAVALLLREPAPADSRTADSRTAATGAAARRGVCRFSSFLSCGTTLTRSAAGCLIDLSLGFFSPICHSSARRASPALGPDGRRVKPLALVDSSPGVAPVVLWRPSTAGIRPGRPRRVA